VNGRFHAVLRDGNRFELLQGGSEFFSRMLAAIEASTSYVLAEFYLVESGRVMDDFIAAFARAAERGVRVRALFDAFGARGLKESDRARIRAVHAELVFFNTPRWRNFPHLLRRNHRKLLLIDGSVGFTGGTGLADMFSPEARPENYWLDCIVEMSGPVLDDWHELFARTWRGSARRNLDVDVRPGTKHHPGEPGCVAAISGPAVNQLERSVGKHIRSAKTRVWLATAYFWPSNRLRRALRRAARRGLDVRLLLPGPHTDAPAARGAARLFYARLLASGVVIYEYQPTFLHAKIVLCDSWVSIGSSNLDRWGVLWNLEANQEIESPRFAGQVETMLVKTCQQSTVLRDPRDVRHGWSVPFWLLVAKAVLAWSTRAVGRMNARLSDSPRPSRGLAVPMNQRRLGNAPRLMVAYLGWLNRYRARPRSYLLLAAALLIGWGTVALLLGMAQRSSTSALRWANRHAFLVAGLAACISGAVVSRRRALSQSEMPRSWLAALPVSRTIARWEAAAIETAPALGATCGVAAACAALLPSLTAAHLSPAALAAPGFAATAGIVVGTVICYLLPVPKATELPPGSRYVPHRRVVRVTNPAPSLSALGRWPVRQMFASARPKAVSRALMPILLMMPLGSTADAAMLVIALSVVIGAMLLLASATIRVSKESCRWLKPLPLRATLLAQCLLGPPLVVNAVAALIAAWLFWIMGASPARSLKLGASLMALCSLMASAGSGAMIYRAQLGRR
jgi:phosphatidylserine/phosphatidylglycerophosphate/cardiolipin synthase-like enzyme